MNAKFMLWKRAARVVLFVLLLNMVGMTKGYAYYDFSAICPSGQRLYYYIYDAENHYVSVTFPGSLPYTWYDDTPKPTGHLVLPETVIYNGSVYYVTTIGDYTFENCDSLTFVEIPNSVITIEQHAFDGTAWYEQQPNGILYLDGWCLGYKGDDMPSGFLSLNETTRGIANYAFMDCDGLTGSLFIPNSVTFIGNGAFSWCSGFTGSLTIPNSVTSIGNYAFEGCSGFTGSLTIPNSVTFLGSGAFNECYFDGVNINMTHIPSSAFSGCEGFTGTLNIGNSVVSIGDWAFDYCGEFSGSLIIGNSVTSLGEGVFSYCSFDGLTVNMANIPDNAFYHCDFMGRLNIGNTVVSIGNGSFQHKEFYGNLIIPNSVTTIGNYAFAGCMGFTGSLTIPNSVTSIGSTAFYECGFTGSLTIPNSVTYMGEDAFYACAFDGVNIDMTNIPDGAFDGCDGFTGPLTIGNSVTTIGSGAFAVCSGLTGSLTIPESVTSIGNNAFAECRGFTGDLIIPNSVITIGEFAFFLCNGFTGNLTIGNSVTTIGDYAFSKGYSDEGFRGTLTIGNSVTTIGRYAFFNNFTGILTIPNSVTSIDEHAFESCHFIGLEINMTDIPEDFMNIIKGDFSGQLTIGTSVTTIGNNAFSDWDEFTGDLIIPNSVVMIGDYAFAYNGGFTGDLTIPNSVISIGDYAFSDCNGFTGNLTIGNSVSSIGSSAFIHCDGFAGNLTIGNSVTSIGDFAFFQCSNLSGSLTIPNSVISIGEYAFYECTGFTGNLTIGNSVSTIESYAFYRCNNFSGSLTIPSSVTSIANGAFNECSFDGLNVDMTSIPDGFMGTINGSFSGSLNIGNSVTTIGNRAFYGCHGFRGDLNIPSSVTSIGDESFFLCFGFTSIHSHGAVPPSTGSNAFDYMEFSIPVYVPHCSAMDYRQTQPWNSFTNYQAVLPCPYTFTGNGTDNLWSNADNWHTLPANDYDIIINAECEIDEDVEASGLIINNTGTLVVKSGHVLTINGDAVRSGDALDGEIVNHGTAANLIIEDGGQLIYDKDGLVGTMKKNISCYSSNENNGWYILSYPNVGSVSVSSVENICNNNYDLYHYDESTQYWINYKNAENNFDRLDEGKGYLYANSEELCLEFAGIFKNGSATMSIPLIYTAGIDYPGYNLVGNPFVHNVTSYASENVADGCFRLNETQDDIIVSEISEAHPLKPAEGFFVKATGENASITFNPQAKAKASHDGSIRLEITENGRLVDRLIVKKEGEPMEKLSLKRQRTKLFANKEYKEMAIIPIEANEQAINFKAAHDGTYTLTVNADENEWERLHFIDNLTGEDIDLLAALRQAQGPASYTFEAKTTDDANRFKLVFSIGGDANVDNDRK